MASVRFERASVRLLPRPTDALGRRPIGASIYLHTSSGEVFGGVCLLPVAIWPLAARADVARRLQDSITALLSQQPVSAFRGLARRLGEATEPLLASTAVRLGVEHALLKAVAAANRRSRLEQLRVEFQTDGGDWERLRLFAEVPDYAATAELFDQVIIQRPDGIGYRLTADDLTGVIGPDALDLQRFARELRARVVDLGADNTYQPIVYLALNGALGQLSTDPRVHFGRMLGPLFGLEKTLAPLSLLVEDPVRLEDPFMQIAVLKQLTEAVRIRSMSARLVARGGLATTEDVELCLQAGAASGISLDAVAWGTVEQLAAVGRQANEAGRELVIRADAAQPYQHLGFLAVVAAAIGASALSLQVSTSNVQSISDLLDDLAHLR